MSFKEELKLNKKFDKKLGPLKDLKGTWIGRGLVITSLPHFDKCSKDICGNVTKCKIEDFRFLVNKTYESIRFNSIQGPVPDRGQPDILMYGLSYEQLADDSVTGKNIHSENGMWMYVPKPSKPSTSTSNLSSTLESVIRMSNIPHGNSLLAESTIIDKSKGPPEFEKLSCLPFGEIKIEAKSQVKASNFKIISKDYKDDNDDNNDDKSKLKNNKNVKVTKLIDSNISLEPILTCSLPPGITQKQVFNPNLLLARDIRKQEIIKTQTIKVVTSHRGIVNSAFIKKNADTTSLESTFWIETVKCKKTGKKFLQLQYTQIVILEFLGFKWPHIAVGTLIKQC